MRFRSTVLGCVISIAVSSSVHATTWTADFFDSSYGGQMSNSGDPGFNASATGGTLTISETHGALVGMTGHDAVYTNAKFSGDFDARVTVNWSQLPSVDSGSYIDGSINMYGNDFSFGNFVTGLSGCNSDVYTCSHAFEGINSVFHGTDFVADNSGTIFRILRLGDTVSEYVGNPAGGDFTLVETDTNPAFADPVTFSLYSYYNNGAPTGDGSVSFTNFSVSTVPEPSSLALLTGFFGVIALRRKRAAKN